MNIPPITSPFTVIIDTREQSPFAFKSFRADAKHRVKVLTRKEAEEAAAKLAELKTVHLKLSNEINSLTYLLSSAVGLNATNDLTVGEFEHIQKDIKDRNKQLSRIGFEISQVPTEYVVPDLYIPTERKGLATGDYSIQGHESSIAIERKSLSDLYGTLGGGRERFERELARLSKMKVAHVVVESDWTTALREPPDRTKLAPKSVFRSINAWEQEFPTIHWQFMGTRELAEHKTFRILERFWVNLQRAVEGIQEVVQEEKEKVSSEA
jgi:hypothetical protein